MKYVICSVMGGVHDQRSYDAALKAARESGRPMCKAEGLVGPCVTWPKPHGYCWMHAYQRPKSGGEGRHGARRDP